jgi:hypothetical protein
VPPSCLHVAATPAGTNLDLETHDSLHRLAIPREASPRAASLQPATTASADKVVVDEPTTGLTYMLLISICMLHIYTNKLEHTDFIHDYIYLFIFQPLNP